MDVNAESSLLQPANRDGGIDQDWAGDDQDWWDWYVTMPIRISARPRGHAGCTLDSAAHVKPEHAAGAARPWLSVEQPTVHTDRPDGRAPSAICPWTPRHAGPQRHTVTHDGTAKKRPG